MANGDGVKAGQGVDATATTVLDAFPYPSIGAALLVRNYVFMPTSPVITGPYPADFVGIQGEGPTGIVGSSSSSLGAGVVGEARSAGATGVFGTGGDYAVWGNGIPYVMPGGGYNGTGVSLGSVIGVVGDSINSAGVFGLSWYGSGVLGRNQEGTGPGVRGEASSYNVSSAGVEGVSAIGPGVFGQSDVSIGVGGRSQADAGVSGTSSDAPGVRGFSNQGVGVQGSSEATTGVEGFGPRMGVFGQSSNGLALVGKSNTGTGVYARSDHVALEAVGKKAAGNFKGDVFIHGALVVLGAKSAAVEGADGTLHKVYCVEAPEPWFEDSGEAELVAGAAEIELDPLFVASIRGKYQVQVTAYAPVSLWVAQRQRDRFVVRAVSEATSAPKTRRRIAFSWRVTARRGDITAKRFASVELPTSSDVSFPVARPQPPSRYAVSTLEAVPSRTKNARGHRIATSKDLADLRSKRKK